MRKPGYKPIGDAIRRVWKHPTISRLAGSICASFWHGDIEGVSVNIRKFENALYGNPQD